MWQAPNAKAAARSAKKPGRDRSRRPLHVMRVTAEIRSVNARTPEGRPEVEAYARILLNDLTAQGVGLFSNKSFVAGQEIAILLAVPNPIYLRGVVTYCQERDMASHIIPDVPFGYRVGIQFVFENAAEQAAVNKYCEDILRTLQAA